MFLSAEMANPATCMRFTLRCRRRRWKRWPGREQKRDHPASCFVASPCFVVSIQYISVTWNMRVLLHFYSLLIFNLYLLY